MLAEIAAGYSSLKAAVDIVKGLNAVNVQVNVNDVKIELGQHLLAAQSALTAAGQIHAEDAERIRSLEAEIISMKNWDADRQRYQLKDSGEGTLAYALKEGMENGEPPHWLCPNCYQEGKKSIMKHETIPQGRAETLVCHPCGMDILIRGVRLNPPYLATGRGRGQR